MPFKWDPTSERNLLLAAIASIGNPPMSIWERVAEEVGGAASTLNGNACRYVSSPLLTSNLIPLFSLYSSRQARFLTSTQLTFPSPTSQKFYKLKKESEAALGGGLSRDDTPATPMPPTPPTPPTKGGRKRKADTVAVPTTPTKRARAKKAAPVEHEIKVEETSTANETNVKIEETAAESVEKSAVAE